MSRETMALYKDTGTNPLSSCLPLLIQMPIFLGIFYVIRDFGGSAGIIGAGDRAASEPTFTEGGLLWFQNLSVHDPYFILPVVSAVTMLLSMEITSKNLPAQQRWIMRLLPFIITVVTWTFPAGLFVYWIANNVVTGVQNYVIYNFGPGRQKTDEEKAAEEKQRKERARAKNGSNGGDEQAALTYESDEAEEEQENGSNGAGKSSKDRTQTRKKKLKKKNRKK